MIPYLMGAAAQMYQFLMPEEDALAGKISQFTGKGRKFSPLEGTIATCKLTDRGTILKPIQPTQLSQRLRMIASVSSVIPGQSRDMFVGLRECTEYETDAAHEFSMLERFYAAWLQHPQIFTPKPIGLLRDTLEMEYVPWKRISDLQTISWDTV